MLPSLACARGQRGECCGHWGLSCMLGPKQGSSGRPMLLGEGLEQGDAGTRTTVSAPTTAPELCVQLLPQCLPGGGLGGFFAFWSNELISAVLVLFSLRGGCLLLLFGLRPRV